MVESEPSSGSRPRGPFKWLFEMALRHAWRTVIAVVGGTVLLLGGIMIFTPGPAMVLIPVGLGILAVEFLWARRLLRRVRTSTKWKLRKLRKQQRPENDRPGNE